MICIDDCAYCKHNRDEMKDGWIPTCDAFPDGIPYEHITNNDVKNIKECNNGVGFEPEEEN